VRQLRGNQPKLQYHYLSLRQSKNENSSESNITEYLKYYPEHKNRFNQFRNTVHYYTNELFTNYIHCYIKKEKELNTFPEKYRTHMYNIHHEIYLKYLLPNNLYVSKSVVINYFNSLHPAKQMYVLNYDTRQIDINTVKIEIS